MQHLDRLIRRHPRLRHVDYNRLVQRVQSDPSEHWAELVTTSSPIVYTMALRLLSDRQDAPAVAERATFELFAALRADNFARLHTVIGLARWPTLLLRWLRETAVLAEVIGSPRLDTETPIPALDDRTRQVLEAEGEPLIEHMRRVLRSLHRRDRLLLAMRYEQELSLRELDMLFRLGTPARVETLLQRLEDSLQPMAAVAAASRLDAHQRRALLAAVVRQIFANSDMQSDEKRGTALAMQHR